LGQHPNPPGTILTPSNTLVAARVGDMAIRAVSLLLAILLAALATRWVAAGFNKKTF
jgi:small neutral amino acid transporter SnatA (MarC family)